MDGNDRVAEFVAGVRYPDLPEAVRRKTLLCLLDNLSATLGGVVLPASRIAAGYAAVAWRGGEATLLLHDRQASAAGAAFANGVSANALDIDDLGRFTRGHPGANIFPTALAVAEKVHAGGAALLAAQVVGYEVAHRAGRIWHTTHEEFQACGSWGSVANAATAAHLLGLEPAQVKHALGIAEYHAPNVPMLRDLAHPAMVKHGIGWAAMVGVVSAELAAAGFTGIPSLLGMEKYQAWVEDIGQNYIFVNGVTFKQYASCGYGHASFAACRKLLGEHAFAVDDIQAIRVEGYHQTTFLRVWRPTTEEEAQFSLAWPLAALLLEGEVGPAQMRPDRFADERILALTDKIEVVESETVDRLYQPMHNVQDEPQARAAAVVEISLKDGRRLNSGIVEREAGPGGSWDEAKVERKFRWLVNAVLPEPRVDELVEMLWNFDQLDDVAQLTQLLRRR